MRRNIYPVIMCGGAGTRLWPASRPSRPKQFLSLSGPRSLFQEAALRVAPLAAEHGRLIVVGGVRHGATIRDQLAAIDVTAVVLLEPTARDSAPAMAAAAAWVVRADPDGILAVVASDHHIPDNATFREAVALAAEAAAEGRIVTLGVMPTEPSSAYGYIKPAGRGLSAVAAFVEKPDRETAATYLAQGYLWNSGNFIVSARTLIDELANKAPAVLEAATASLPPADGAGPQSLGDGFASAPAVSIDYAVMEKTIRASVLAVDFAWHDLGAWDSVAALGQNSPLAILESSENCLIRAPDGVVVAALGVSNLGIIVEKDAVLVCDLSRSQDVKRVVERVRQISPERLDFPAAAPREETLEPLPQSAARLADWLRTRALPTWATLGLTADGVFAEALTLKGRPLPGARNARVQADQIRAYAMAGKLGWAGPWRSIVAAGLETLHRDFVRPDGQLLLSLGADATPLDDTSAAKAQAAVVRALDEARAADVHHPSLEAWTRAIRAGLPASASDEEDGEPQLLRRTQTLRAALARAQDTSKNRDAALSDVTAALDAMWRHLTPDGLWHDDEYPSPDALAQAGRLADIVAVFAQMTRPAACIAELEGLNLA